MYFNLEVNVFQFIYKSMYFNLFTSQCFAIKLLVNLLQFTSQ